MESWLILQKNTKGFLALRKQHGLHNLKVKFCVMKGKKEYTAFRPDLKFNKSQ
jgi:hypothetical protein